MGLASDYRHQLAWRDWRTALDALPPLAGQIVLDLGCGVGDQAAALVARGARVIGFDLNEELLAEARSRALANAVFRRGDLAELPDLGIAVDGVWCSFAAAYFPDLAPVLAGWVRPLRPGGWIALTEIDDLFAHEPLGARTRALLRAYADEALAARRYDFRMGRKLAPHLLRSGCVVTKEVALADEEFAFAGPARPEVVEAWSARISRMKLLHDACGAEFEAVREDFLGCLRSPAHRAEAGVVFVVAERPVAGAKSLR